MSNFSKTFVDIKTKVFRLDTNGNPVGDEIIAVDYTRVLEGEKIVDNEFYVLKSDINKLVLRDSFHTSLEEMKKSINDKIKVVSVPNKETKEDKE